MLHNPFLLTIVNNTFFPNIDYGNPLNQRYSLSLKSYTTLILTVAVTTESIKHLTITVAVTIESINWDFTKHFKKNS